MNNILTDDSPMPFGKFKGKRMEEVPAAYLIWLHENNKCSGNVKAYIEDNLDALRLELKQPKN